MIVFSLRKNIVIQFAPQLFSMVPSLKMLYGKPRPTVISAKCRQEKYEVNKIKASSISLPC